MNEKEAVDLIKKLTGVNVDSIKIYDDGFLSRGFVIDKGRIVFKFPRQTDVKYDNEIAILNFVNGLDLDVNLQKVGWISKDNSYLGIHGVVGNSIEVLVLSNTQLLSIGNQLGRFLKGLHQAQKSDSPRLTLRDEISFWQKRYQLTKEFINRNFSPNEQTLLARLMYEYMPSTLLDLGENLVFSHGDLGDGNIFIDDQGKVGVIDFNSSCYFEEAADFMDVRDDSLRKIMLDAYVADERLIKKVEIRKDIRPIIVLLAYLQRGDNEIISNLLLKIRQTIKKYEKI